MIEAVIFDMDGLLIDSEPFWQEAEIQVFDEIGLRLDHEMCSLTIGLRVRDVVQYWYDRRPWDATEFPVESIAPRIVDRVCQLVLEKGEALPGVYDTLAFFDKLGLPMGLATSSDYPLIEAVLRRLDIAHFFDALHSGQDEEYGKPHPATYLRAANKLKVTPHKCLALEDSLVGVLSAKAARMTCIAVPERRLKGDPRFSIADLILPTLSDFSEAHWEQLNHNLR